MNISKSMNLIKKYENCPKCGNDKLGKNQGGLILEENTLTRFCKCGFDKTVDENDNEVKKICLNCKNEIKKREIMYCDSCKKEICFTCWNEKDGHCNECYENL